MYVDTVNTIFYKLDENGNYIDSTRKYSNYFE